MPILRVQSSSTSDAMMPNTTIPAQYGVTKQQERKQIIFRRNPHHFHHHRHQLPAEHDHGA